MAMRLSVEGDECKVDKFTRHLLKDKRYKYYQPHIFLTSSTEKKAEFYVEETPSRMKEIEKKSVCKVEFEMPEGQKIELELLNVKRYDLNDGKITVHGKSYDIFADPSCPH